jgi:hypothetical protein
MIQEEGIDVGEERSEGQRGDRSKGTGARPAALSFALALVASLILLFVPTGTTSSSFCSVAPAPTSPGGTPGSPTCTSSETHPSLVDEQGWGVAIPLSIPVVVAGIPVAVTKTRARRPASIAATSLLLAFTILGAASVGIFYLPSAVAMIVAASHRSPAPVAT